MLIEAVGTDVVQVRHRGGVVADERAVRRAGQLLVLLVGGGRRAGVRREAADPMMQAARLKRE